MKICLYNVTTANKIGGIETYCWELARTLQLLGHEVEIISGEGTLIKYSEIPLKLFPYRPREKFPDLGTRFRKFMERLSFFINAKDYLRTKKFDVFVVKKPFDFVVTTFIKKHFKDTCTVFISGGEDFWYFDKIFFKSIDLPISVSNANAKIIEKRYKIKPLVIPIGVDIKKFKPLKEEGIKLKKSLGINQKKVILSIGRMVGLKGYQLVIKALTQLPEEYVYVLIGDGPYLKKLKILSRELRVENRVLFLGKKNHNELPPYYSIGDIFVQPTIGNETLPTAVIEAMACGLPVVESASGGIKELVKDNFNGYLFEIGKVDQLVEKIKKTFKYKEKLSENTREFVKENLNWEIVAKKLINIFEKTKQRLK